MTNEEAIRLHHPEHADRIIQEVLNQDQTWHNGRAVDWLSAPVGPHHYSVLASAFDWSRTPERSKFWGNLRDEARMRWHNWQQQDMIIRGF